MNVAAELLDDRGVCGLPPSPGSLPAALRRLLGTSGNPVLRAAVAAVLRSGDTETLAIENLHLVCVPLAPGPTPTGALVVAREIGQAPDMPAEKPASLEAIAAWLAHAAEAHLASSAGDDGAAFRRVSSLHRILSSAASRGDEAGVVFAFAEALAVWDDLEVTGFVEDTRGRIIPGVALLGAEPPPRLATIDEHVMPPQTTIRLSSTDAERLGLASDRDVLITRFGGAGFQPWVITFTGAIGTRDEPRLSLYVDLLREAVSGAATLAATRLSASILRRLLGGAPGAEAAERSALADLAAAVGAVDATVVATAPDRRQLLSAGLVDDAYLARPGAFGDSAAATRMVPGVGQLTLSVRRASGEPFTHRERHLLDGAADVFAAWLPGALRSRISVHDRRSGARPFDDVLEQMAARTVRDGVDVSVVVIAAGDEAPPARALHGMVGDIREVLRASDVAGALSEREIAVFLSGTGADEAAVVASRLQQRLQQAEAALPLAIGVASRRAGSDDQEPVVRAARADAARRACA